MFHTSLQARHEGIPWGAIGGVLAFAGMLAIGYLFGA